jgi:hypothetical protein
MINELWEEMWEEIRVGRRRAVDKSHKTRVAGKIPEKSRKGWFKVAPVAGKAQLIAEFTHSTTTALVFLLVSFISKCL